MAVRRRRFRRSFAGKKGGRSYYWFRFTPFFLTPREANTATHSDLILEESDWANPSIDVNQTQRGGARLERFIVDYGLAVYQDIQAFGIDGYLTLIPEFLVWKQSDQFVTFVTNSATFNQTRDNQRVIMDEVPTRSFSAALVDNDSSPGRSVLDVRGRYETKSKVRLSDGAIGMAWRGNFNEASENVIGFTDWVRPTILMSTP